MANPGSLIVLLQTLKGPTFFPVAYDSN